MCFDEINDEKSINHPSKGIIKCILSLQVILPPKLTSKPIVLPYAILEQNFTKCLVGVHVVTPVKCQWLKVQQFIWIITGYVISLVVNISEVLINCLKT